MPDINLRIVRASIVLFILGTSAYAQAPSDAEIFDAAGFDKTVQKSTQADKKESLTFLAGGTLLFDSATTVPADFSGYATGGSFAGKLFGKVSVPQNVQLYLAYNLTHTIYAGVGGTSSPGGPGFTGVAPADLFANQYALSEFFLDFDVARILFVRIGNQLIAWGPSYVWTPVDFINLQRSSSLQSVDLRVGKPGIKLFLPFPSADITLFTDMSDTLTGGVVHDLAKTANLAIRAAATVGGFEFGLSSYLGQSVQGRYGFDFSGRALGTNIYGELGAGFPYGGYDFAYAYSVGFTRALGDLKRWTLSGEFFYNSAGTSDIGTYPALVASGGFTPLYVGRIYGYAAVSRDEFLGSFLRMTLSGLINASDLSYQAKLASAFSIPALVPFTVAVAWNGGGAGREFTYFTGNNALTLDLQILVQF
ncbi:MAG TPA: hypothetical protein VMW87_06825 [Spirochaetia bacterium]|nr:hypothetical protein [Spirochaetia bacterium]